MTHLLACACCARHVRACEAVCPFCGASAPSPGEPVRQPRAAPAARLGRAALYAFGVGSLTVTATVAGCNHESSDAVVAVYGGPPPELADHPVDAGPDAPHSARPSSPPR
jgi:hypothetical protein